MLKLKFYNLIYAAVFGICYIYLYMGFPGSSVVNSPPAYAGDSGDPSLGQEDPLEKEMATHSNTLAWEILWTEETGRLQSDMTEHVHAHTHIYICSI